MCAICLNAIGLSSMTTECKHNFHTSCLVQWMSHNPFCPLCRSELYIEEPNDLFAAQVFAKKLKFKKAIEYLTKIEACNLDAQIIVWDIIDQAKTHVLLLRETDVVEALNIANAIVNLYPKDVQSKCLRALILFDLKKYNESLIDLDSCLLLDAFCMNALSLRSKVYKQMQKDTK